MSSFFQKSKILIKEHGTGSLDPADRVTKKRSNHTLLLPILEFVLDKKLQRNASEFAIFYMANFEAFR